MPMSPRMLFSLLAYAVLVAPSVAADKPNVVIVMTDDQGYGDLACHGNPVLRTPNLDRLHARSARLTDFHVAPMCTPTRGQLMSGRDALDNGATFVNRRSMMRHDLPTMASIFSNAGYRTGLFGKWHLGDSYPARPIDRGFDTVIRHRAWGITSLADYFGNDYFDDTYLHNARYEEYDGYCTDVWFGEAMRWMKACRAADERFLCYIPTNVPHVPHWVADRYAKPYRGKGPAEFFGMIANLDENMGRLVEFLKETGMAENTILVFLTDNGTATGENVFNADMRGKKRSLYEGGHRVPCFIHWPSGGLDQPRDVEALTHVQDLLPTLLDMCEVPAPRDADFDGVSLLPLLRSESETLPDPDRMLVVQYGEPPRPGAAAVLWKKWRLVEGKELYRVDQDPGQQRNVASDHPDVVERMRAHYQQWWEDVQPNLKDTPPILLGAEEANPTILYASDWRGDYADNWGGLRGGNKKGHWNVRVAQPGDYRLTLYRWPPEAEAALDAPLSGPCGKGAAVPIRAANVKIGDFEKTWPAPSGAHSAACRVSLDTGDYTLNTLFFDAQGKPLCSAYYLEVQKLP